MSIVNNKYITAVVQIGNSDDKLKQYQWNKFYEDTEKVINAVSSGVHFSGCGMPNAPWQNACFVIEVEKENVKKLMLKLNDVRKNWNQDSVAVTIGSTYFVNDEIFADWISNFPDDNS